MSLSPPWPSYWTGCWRKSLNAAKLPFSTEEALAHLRTVQVVQVDLKGAKRRGVTTGNQQARRILSALQVSSLEPWKEKK
jgi:hypothetical protein